jgi:hypothetical protein
MVDVDAGVVCYWLKEQDNHAIDTKAEPPSVLLLMHTTLAVW